MTGVVGVSVDAGDVVETAYRTGYKGRQYATLRIGNALGLDVADASPEVLREIAAAAEELAAWAEARDAAAEVPNQVAAEGGVRTIGVPYQRDRRAA
ncbi:hypothetical protein PV405_29995 [Streptomyces sp. ME02-6979-3A]|uniref:hypothetical protein n=1 Tax=Streptomyces sp. ME02-6979-3A TaxID=3028673 RepID=UPI0029AC9A05|nr:hypothetical protein [Streptomyces sp. ME02-6979-3A]MDX3328845.1 hypothetical protein [Streptomyces sp. ME02-6979-3A]